MRIGFIASAVLTLGMFPASPLLAQSAPTQAGAAQTIPALSGIWEAPDELNSVFASGGRSDICGEGACEAVLKFRPNQLIVTVEEPQMLPWAEELYRSTRREGSNARREDADPWFSACMSMGPSRMMLDPFTAVEIRQFPNVVLLFFGSTGGMDHEVRRVYVDGREHPPNVKPTWMGHSVGKYEGDTLVVDTVGISDKTWIDGQGHPHTDALHLVERIRRMDANSLEFEVTIDDPKTYKNSWRKKVVRQLAAPGARLWDDSICQELLQMGTHYGAEARR